MFIPYQLPHQAGHGSSMWKATGLESLETNTTVTAMPQHGNNSNLNSLNR